MRACTNALRMRISSRVSPFQLFSGALGYGGRLIMDYLCVFGRLNEQAAQEAGDRIDDKN